MRQDILEGRLLVLTGAGVSTDSGIPDYRGPRPAGAPVPTPMTYGEFVAGGAARQRYWARAYLGWGRMGRAQPNAGHRALASMQADGRVPVLITQNVDGLHEEALPGPDAGDVVALHGRIADVICLDCRRVSPRRELQVRMAADNPGWSDRHAAVASRPDGDVALEATGDFVVPECAECGGRLKPDVVFFGENVPAERVQRCYAEVERCDALLVVGSSLTVMSGLRFVKAAARRGVPIVIVNRGATRGDELATLKVEAGASEFLTELSGAGSPAR